MPRTEKLEIERWYGCYGRPGFLFTPESNSHPAKMGVGLCYRIFDHGQRRGYWSPGDLILDPMAGIFTTGIVGASLYYRVVGVELERHFIELAQGNIARVRRALPLAPPPVILQGDTMRLTQVLARGDAVLTSMPYSDQNADKPRAADNPRERYDGCITSPPFAQAKSGGGINIQGYGDGSDKVGERTYSRANVGSDPAQIGNLPDRAGDIDGVLTSPPFENCLPGGRGVQVPHDSTGNIANAKYGQSQGQLGVLQGKTYMSAMLEVCRQLALVLKRGGVVCLVTKNPVKNGRIRELDKDIIRLMEAAGFTLLERQMAMLSEDLGELLLLDGGATLIRRERKSFFKRLFEAKRPDLRVCHEDVLWFSLAGSAKRQGEHDGKQ